jgi:hypothetical protein
LKVEVTDIPSRPEEVEVSIPMLGGEGADGSDSSGILEEALDLAGAQVVALDEEFELRTLVSNEAGADLDLGSLWTVNGLAEDGDLTEVSVAGRGRGDASFTLPNRHAAHLEPGSLIAAPADTLYRIDRFFGAPKVLVQFQADPGVEPFVGDIWLPIPRSESSPAPFQIEADPRYRHRGP